ncbi:MAG: hypothetical protein JWO15_2336 [Sphingomonadales bacterium]|nr:hypothetical protein [Sphingomonadales bacterium]
MNGPSFFALLRWEVRRVGRAPLLWIVLVAIVASFVWGAATTATLPQRQAAAHERIAAEEADWLSDVKKRAAQYRRAAPPGTADLPTWQDPTDLSGFARFFLLAHSLKPHLPLSVLATGNSDLAPSWLQVKVNVPFAGEPTYDFENPRSLAIGTPGLDFAIVYLLPIGLILLFGLLGTFERDHGMLPLIAAQPISPRRWLFARLSAILAWTVPVVLAGLLIALTTAGVAIGTALPTLGTALALVAAYILFWTALAAAVLATWPGAAAAVGAMTSLWAMLTIGLPLLATLVLATVVPAPSRTAYLDLQRRVSDAVENQVEVIVARDLARDSLFAGKPTQEKDVKDLARISFTLPEIERRLMLAHAAFGRHHVDQLRIATVAGYAVPPLGLSIAMAGLAGTDDARQIRYEQRTADYQQQLRTFFFTLARQQVVRPVPFDPIRSRGRLNFTDFDSVPRYVVPVEQSDVASTWLFCAWLAGVGALILLAVGLRLREWPGRE